jgi:hypothetical protein
MSLLMSLLMSLDGVVLRAVLLAAAATPAPPSRAAPPQAAPPQAAKLPMVKLAVKEKSPLRIDVLVDGRPFTSYTYPTALKKPVLFPIVTPAGTPITRGYPFEARAGERTDHPHHVGLWFNYGDVDGVDFWNNSDQLPADRQKAMGTIVQGDIRRVAPGLGAASLDVVLDWTMPDGKVALREATSFTFAASEGRRAIDRVATLTAINGPVRLPDNKEGLLGLRLARALEHPSKKPAVMTDASGKPTKIPALDNTGVTGVYRTSEGKIGDEAWGTRGRWAMLTGTLPGSNGDEEVTIAILDHPKNPGYPTYWHARGYGLFAANSLGQKALSDGKDALDFRLAKGQSARFAYRVLILSRKAKPDEIEAEHKRFVKSVP